MIVGEKDAAKHYLGKFSWGLNFITLNLDLLELYSSCKDSDQLISEQNSYLEKLQEEAKKRKGEFLQFKILLYNGTVFLLLFYWCL